MGNTHSSRKSPSKPSSRPPPRSKTPAKPPPKDPATTILDLPNELLLIVAESLSDPAPDPSSVAAFLLANRRLAFLLTPHLHRLARLDRPDGTPALHWALTHNHLPLASLLLSKATPATLARLDPDQQTALHIALDLPPSDPPSDIPSTLIRSGAPINAQNTAGETPLQLAVSKGYEPLVTLLLAHGADIALRDSKGQTVLHVATRNWGNGGSTAIATLLLDAGVDLDARNNLGETALHKAVLFAHTSMVRLLLSRGASTSIADNWWGGTPLHWAADMGKHDIGKLLIASGAEVQARDVFKGGTPFHWAAKRPTEAMLRLLLGMGADVDVVDNAGKKAVEWTVRQERRRGPREERVITELLRRGVTSVPECDEREWGYGGSAQANAYTLAALYCLHYQNVRATG